MKHKLIEALSKWFSPAVAGRLAGALLEALLGGVTNRESDGVVAAVAALARVLADEHRTAAQAAIDAAPASAKRRVAAVVLGEATEFGQLAARLQERLPPEDPRVEGWQHPDGSSVTVRQAHGPRLKDGEEPHPPGGGA